MTNLPSPGLRAGSSSLEVIDRRSPVRFSFNGRPVAALAGDTIISALMANGIRAFAQGRRLQTKRGVLTADRFDPCCFLQVDDEPNVPAAHRLVVDGMRVRSQHVWPSLRFDLKAINQRATRALRPPSQLRASTAAGFLRPAYRWLTA
ncbi:MAG: sarcosine oxidase, subunit alpha, partial [Acidimicrobiia bacterium]|nr:sarcosine oxidase, subunit alpha [Acidimicrobiia bacterium]